MGYTECMQENRAQMSSVKVFCRFLESTETPLGLFRQVDLTETAERCSDCDQKVVRC